MGTRGPHSHEGVPNLPVEWGPGVPNIPVDWGRGPYSTGRLGTRGPQNRGSPKYRDTGRQCLHARPKGFGDYLGRHFLNREGALIHYLCACVHFFTEFFSACTCAKRDRRRSRIVAAPNCVLKLIVAAASLWSYTVVTSCILSNYSFLPNLVPWIK